MIKAIETVYNGYRFRSRLEARWAVFFDTLGVKYEYEKEGYDLDGVWYLPDFWLPELNCWFEVKGENPPREEYAKMQRLARQSNKRLYVAVGEIKIPSDNASTYVEFLNSLTDIHAYFVLSEIGIEELKDQEASQWVYPDSSTHSWCECPSCDSIKISSGHTVKEMSCPCFPGKFQQNLLSRMRSLDSLFSIPQSEENDEMTKEYIEKRTKNFGDCSAHDSPRLIAAYTAARQARFEHGEKGR